ncbi:hypothetical protein Q8F55_009272 [Vanrija albida]|uniref:WSC domain-containing protein n=1 Tax=Vanrija albida TaxID=181172 RepID=A0ABR3PU56_9TREE
MLALALVALAAAVPALGAITPPPPSDYYWIFSGCAPANAVHAYNNYAKAYGLSQLQCDDYLSGVFNSVAYSYSFYISASGTAQSECFLGNQPIVDYTLTVPADSPDGSCAPGQARVGVMKNYASSGPTYEWRWAGCYREMTQSPTPPYDGSFFNGGRQAHYGNRLASGLDRAGCLSACTTSISRLKYDYPEAYYVDRYAYVLYWAYWAPEKRAGFESSCHCVLGPVEGTPVACEDYGAEPKFSFTQNYLYVVEIESDEPSGAPERRRAQRRRKQALLDAEMNPYCPSGLIACRVAEGSDGYECLDTTSELESCGGCRFGEYGLKNGTTRGTKREVMGKE